MIERSVILSSGDVFPSTSRGCHAIGPADDLERDARAVSRRAPQRTRDNRSRAGRVSGPGRRAVRGRREARRAAIHARPSHQGVEHRQGAIQVPLTPPSHQIHQIHQIRQISPTPRSAGLVFAAFSVSSRLAPRLPVACSVRRRRADDLQNRPTGETGGVVLRVSGRIAGDDLEVLRSALEESGVVAVELAEASWSTVRR